MGHRIRVKRENSSESRRDVKSGFEGIRIRGERQILQSFLPHVQVWKGDVSVYVLGIGTQKYVNEKGFNNQFNEILKEKDKL